MKTNTTGASLTLIELARCAAFFDVLRLTVDEEKRCGREPRFSLRRGEKGADPCELLQLATVSRANLYAEKFGVSFPDETERETLPLSARDALDECDANDLEAFADMEAEVADSDMREVFESVED